MGRRLKANESQKLNRSENDSHSHLARTAGSNPSLFGSHAREEWAPPLICCTTLGNIFLTGGSKVMYNIPYI